MWLLRLPPVLRSGPGGGLELILVAIAVGYLMGALPTAAAMARVRGVNLRSDGSGNPGANNALRLGGPSLAASVLLVEMTKGVVAVLFAQGIAGDAGAIAAAIAAVAGNVYNVFYRFDGGKGLGITGGVLLAAWPTVLLPAIAVLIAAVLITRSSGAATIVTVVALDVLAILWAARQWPMAWGVEAGYALVGLSLAITVLLWRKHWRDARFRTPRPA